MAAATEQGAQKMTPELVDAETIAQHLGVSASWVKRHTRTSVAGKNAIPHVRLGKAIRFSLPAVMEWVGKQQR